MGIFLLSQKTFQFLLVIFLLFLFNSTPSFGREDITICGTGDSQNLLQDLARTFEKDHPGIKINVPDSIGSSGGIRMTAEGKCDLGRIARPLNAKEKTYNLNHMFFALSPVVFVVHKSVTISDLTTEHMIGILSGRINNWKDLGGPDMKIFIARREAGDSSRTILERKIPQLREIEIWAGETTYSTKETVDTVNTYKGTFSFAPLSMCGDTEITTLTYNSIAPTTENVQSGKYPFALPLGLVWKDELRGTSKDFSEFIKSHKGREILLQYHALPML